MPAIHMQLSLCGFAVSDGEMGQAAADLASRYEHQDGQAQQDQHGDLASTLRALAEQSPSFEGEPEGWSSMCTCFGMGFLGHDGRCCHTMMS